MLNEQELEVLKQRVNDAWVEFQEYQYEKVEPHFYKEKKGRRMELINPWKTLKERDAASLLLNNLYVAYFALYMEYFRETGERLPAKLLYRKQEMPNGDRYIRRSDL